MAEKLPPCNAGLHIWQLFCSPGQSDYTAHVLELTGLC